MIALDLDFLTYSLFVLIGLVNFFNIARRWKKIGNFSRFLSVSGLFVGLSFLWYGATGFLGIQTHFFREFVHAALFLFGWGFASTIILGKPKRNLLFILAKVFLATALCVYFFGDKGFAFGSLLAIAFVFHYTTLFQGIFPSVTALVMLLNVGSVFWMLEIFS